MLLYAVRSRPCQIYIFRTEGYTILQADLREYIRKQSYQFHDEPVSEGERTAIARAIAFFSGLETDEKHTEEVSVGEPGNKDL